MMARSHSLMGLTVGTVAATALDHAPLLVRILIIPVVGGAALFPDIDKPGSRISRSLGIFTMLTARAVAWFAAAVYDATTTDLDSQANNGGHRRLTHTPFWAALVGSADLLVNRANIIAGSALLVLMTGLPVGLFKGSIRRGLRSVGFRFRHVVLGLTVGSGPLFLLVMTRYPAWLWVWPSAVALGVTTHLAGDWVTNTGLPNPLFPIVVHGRRWGKVRCVLTFDTGTAFETEVVTPLLAVSLTLSSGVMAVTPQTLWHLLVAR